MVDCSAAGDTMKQSSILFPTAGRACLPGDQRESNFGGIPHQGLVYKTLTVSG